MHKISELTTEEEWQGAWPVLHSLRPDLSLEDFLRRRPQLLKDAYRLFGVSVGGRVVSVAGIHIYPHVTRERDFWVHDLATAEDARSQGFGLELMRFLEKLALESGCTRLSVHTRQNRVDAQRFYELKAGYERYAVVYVKNFQ